MFKKIYRFDSISSTNDACFKLIENGEEEGTVVVADEQTNGRGRFKRTWVSPKNDGLYFSIIIKPKIDRKYISLFTLAAALSAINVIKSIAKCSAFIKWPNDVIIKGKKVAGILAEIKNSHLIIGIGININNSIDNFDRELRDRATSLKIETGLGFDKEPILSKILKEYELYYKQIDNFKYENILNEIKNGSCTLGKEIKVERDGNIIYGKALDIDETGALIIEDANGKILSITSGDLSDGNQRSPRSDNS